MIEGADIHDSTSISNLKPTSISHNLHPNLTGLRVGIPNEYMIDELSKDIIQMWKNTAEWLREAGATVSSLMRRKKTKTNILNSSLSPFSFSSSKLYFLFHTLIYLFPCLFICLLHFSICSLVGVSIFASHTFITPSILYSCSS